MSWRDEPAERVRWAVEYGSQIHPQYATEFENGVSVAWHRVPSQLGCGPGWTEELRLEHYKNLCEIDNRVVLVGDQCSAMPHWQEGAILSSLDAITRLHERVVSA